MERLNLTGYAKASTGPRPRGRGNHRHHDPRPTIVPSFNGAAPARARKLAAVLFGFSWIKSFNGAAPARARKCRQTKVNAAGKDQLQRGRARAGAEIKTFYATTGIIGRFNGAAPARARKLTPFAEMAAVSAVLQRGRARAGAEISERSDCMAFS